MITLGAMDAVRFGLAVRALRRRHGWTQAELARRAEVSQSAVSRTERGDAWRQTVRTLVRITEALGARTAIRLLWRGEALDRLLDETHAALVEAVVRLLTAAGWDAVPEATFSIWGERGSIDVLAFHARTGALLVVEVKSVVPDIQAMLAGIDRKARLAPAVADGRGWRPRSVSRLLVLPEDRTARRRLARHAATVRRSVLMRTIAVRRWLRDPGPAMGGVLFLAAGARSGNRPRRSRPVGTERSGSRGGGQAPIADIESTDD